MIEPTGTQPLDDADLADLSDPIAGVAAEELSRRFVRFALAWAEPMVSDLAADETFLRRPGGPELAQRVLAQRFYQRLDPHVYRMLRTCVPLAHAETALDGIEETVRARFAEVAGTAVSYLLSDGRDTAIQMVAVAATVAGRDVRAAVAAIVGGTRLHDDDR